MLENSAYVMVQRGELDPPRKRKYIIQQELTIGRQGGGVQPDIVFLNPYISRRHVAIRSVDGQYEIVDLSSKHGTEVDGRPIHNTSCILQHGARISLAKGTAELIFLLEHHDIEATKEFTRDFGRALTEACVGGLTILPERREAYIDGARLPLSGKDMDLLALLYRRSGEAVSYEEIMLHIWPERMSDESSAPDVGRNEVNALLYRLRKKLGPHGAKIVTIPRYGCRFEG